MAGRPGAVGDDGPDGPRYDRRGRGRRLQRRWLRQMRHLRSLRNHRRRRRLVGRRWLPRFGTRQPHGSSRSRADVHQGLRCNAHAQPQAAPVVPRDNQTSKIASVGLPLVPWNRGLGAVPKGWTRNRPAPRAGLCSGRARCARPPWPASAEASSASERRCHLRSSPRRRPCRHP